MASDADRLARLRRLLLFTALAGMGGTGLELLFIEHFEDPLQLAPLVLLPAGVSVLAWHGLRGSAVTARVVRLVMALFVAGGLAGIVLHYSGNQEFELEMYPSKAGMELVRETLTGATPVLAPGSMILLGLIGLAAVYGTPAGPQRGPDFREENVP